MNRIRDFLQSRELAPYLLALCTVLFASLVRVSLSYPQRDAAALWVFTLGIVGSAWWGGLRSGLSATAMSGLVLAYYFLPPNDSLEIASAEDVWELGVFCGVGSLISVLSEGRQKARRAHSLADEEKQDLKILLEAQTEKLRAVQEQTARMESTLGEVAQLLNQQFGEALRQTRQELETHREDPAAIHQQLSRLDALFGYAHRFLELPYPRAMRTEVSMDAVLNEALARSKDEIAQSSATIHRVPLPTVHGDKEQLVAVFEQLLRHAVSQPGLQKLEVFVSVAQLPDEWRFLVLDTGAGEAIHKQADPGLAVAQRIAELYGGHLSMKGVPGRGTTARFSLPRRKNARALGEDQDAMTSASLPLPPHSRN